MKMEIIEKRKIPLLERTDITAELDYDKETPGRNIVRKALAEQLKADEKLIVVRHIYTTFGLKKAKVLANLYDKTILKDVEGIYLKRHEKVPGEKKEVKEEAPKEKKEVRKEVPEKKETKEEKPEVKKEEEVKAAEAKPEKKSEEKKQVKEAKNIPAEEKKEK